MCHRDYGYVWVGWLAILLAAVFAEIASAQNRTGRTSVGSSQVLVTVNGDAITNEALERMFQSRQVPEKLRKQARKEFLNQMIDAQLMTRYLADRKAAANNAELEEQVARVRRLVEMSNEGKTLEEMGYSEQFLRKELALPLAWKAYLGRIVTEKRIADYFDKHREEFDGTQVRASHILLKVRTSVDSPELKAAFAKAERIRSDILAGKTTFAEAAAEYSDAPSKETGGDVGLFPWRGKMPAAFSKVAFAMKPNEISKPFTSPFGVHLCLVTDREPGQLSQEDARGELLTRLSEELWAETVQGLREKARIEWQVEL